MAELAGDFAYQLAPGSAIRMRIEKMGPVDPQSGSFEGIVRKTWFTNPAGDEVPNIPLLANLFFMWDDEVDIQEEEGEVVQSFVIKEHQSIDFASSTFSKIVHALADIASDEVHWPNIIHDRAHWAHDADSLRQMVREGVEHGIITSMLAQRPLTIPSFLQKIG